MSVSLNCSNKENERILNRIDKVCKLKDIRIPTDEKEEHDMIKLIHNSSSSVLFFVGGEKSRLKSHFKTWIPRKPVPPLTSTIFAVSKHHTDSTCMNDQNWNDSFHREEGKIVIGEDFLGVSRILNSLGPFHSSSTFNSPHSFRELKQADTFTPNQYARA